MNPRRAAKLLGIRPARLRAWEAGTQVPDANELERAIHVYGTDLDKVWPDRKPLVDDHDPGVLIVGDDRIETTGTNRQILTAYLDAVRRYRDVEPNEVVELRAQDVRSLSAVLDLDDAELESLLSELFQLTPAGARLTMRALAVGALGTLGLSAALGATWLSAGAAASTTGELAAPPAATASPFSVDPTEVEVELAPAVFAVAPATEWTPVEVDEDDSIQIGAGEIGPGEIGVGEIEAPSIRADG